MRIEERIPRREKENLCHVVIQNLDIIRRSLESIILSMNEKTYTKKENTKNYTLYYYGDEYIKIYMNI